MTQSLVIAGAGHAAGQTVVSLRQAGFDGPITMVGEEPYPPYQRPPLSKKFLAGELELERLLLRRARYYRDHDIDLRLSTRVETIDRDHKSVLLSDGERLHYDSLVAATGSQARQLNIPGHGLTGINYLRTVDDVLRIRKGFSVGERLVVVGGGYIGLEVAAVAVSHGLHVTVLEVVDRVMSRVVAPPVSEFFESIHREAGVKIRCGARPAAEFVGRDSVQAVVLDDGEEVPADLVLIGVGILPNVALASAAGLECDDGIVVDEFCRSSDPDILAVGDCTNHPNSLLGRRLRLESVHNAQEQAKTAAATLCNDLKPYAQIPWFWSDQYDIKLQIVGLSGDHDEIAIRGDPASRSFAVFYLRAGQLIAVDAINSAREFMLAKKLIAAGAHFSQQTLEDSAIDFKQLAADALA